MHKRDQRRTAGDTHTGMHTRTSAKAGRHTDPLRNIQTGSKAHTHGHTYTPRLTGPSTLKTHKQDQTHRHAHKGGNAPMGTQFQIPTHRRAVLNLQGQWVCWRGGREVPVLKWEPQSPCPLQTPWPQLPFLAAARPSNMEVPCHLPHGETDEQRCHQRLATLPPT